MQFVQREEVEELKVVPPLEMSLDKTAHGWQVPIWNTLPKQPVALNHGLKLRNLKQPFHVM